MHTILTRAAARTGFLLATSLGAGPTMAQVLAPVPLQTPAGVAEAPLSPAAAAEGFYQELGSRQGVDAIVAEYVTLMLKDKRVNATFDGVDLDRLRAKLAEQFCEVSGGPCRYSGKSMAESHEDLKTTNAQFNAAVENLQLAMARHGVPSRVQNRLLAKLAPTQREIVTK